MRILNQKRNLFIAGCCFIGIASMNAQNTSDSGNTPVFSTPETPSLSDPTVTIKQDPRIKQLLDIKTQMDKDGVLSKNYRVQLYNGNNAQAQKVIKKAKATFPQWETDLKWETPDFKVWIGNFRNKLETDRALKEIKKEFVGAFSFKPEKK